MKTKEELNRLKTEYVSLANRLVELTDKELSYVTGGTMPLSNLGKIRPTNGTNSEWSSNMDIGSDPINSQK